MPLRSPADYAGLLDQLDAAVIAAPTSLHHALRGISAAGVHLLVEKPLCTTRTDADDLVSVARRRGSCCKSDTSSGSIRPFTRPLEVANPKYIEAVRASGFTFRSTDVGVVFDLMIHDIDLVFSMVNSPLRKVEALGVSVVGGHEDVANARLEFESGCVASLSASRVSYEAVRRMHVWSGESFVAIDFATRTATTVRPSEALLKRQFSVESLTPEQLEHCRAHFAEEHLPRESQTFDAVDALALEIDDFIESIRTPRPPRVSGEAGRDALAIAEEILARINARP